MQTMKIIDLFNDIANGKKLPKTIIFDTETYHLNPNNHYVRECGDTVKKLENDYNLLLCLNDEAEIIEEKSKKIDKIIIEYDNKDEICKLAYMNNCYELNPQEVIILDKIEELRNSVNYLLEKSDKND